jgi:predicted O-methyltransferase YrrM
MLTAFRNWLVGDPSLQEWSRLHRIDFSSGLGNSAWLLYGLVRAMMPTVCVEIGSANGRSACFIGKALKDNRSGTLYAIDPHEATKWNDSGAVESLNKLRENLANVGLDGHVKIIRKSSQDAAKEWTLPIDLLFIDGDHNYNGVKHDWEHFAPHVTRFGVVVFHDTLWELNRDSKWYRADMGVPRFVDELRQQGYPVLTLARDYGVSMVQLPKAGIALLDAMDIPSQSTAKAT